MLLGQAHHTADYSDLALVRVLGPALDLLVWIPKVDLALAASDWRPLQLPTCWQRLFGSSLIDIVQPVVEPLLSPH